jgi:hypothetical protein
MSFLTNVLNLLPRILPQQPSQPVQPPSQSQSDSGAGQSPFANDQFQSVEQLLQKMLASQSQDDGFSPSSSAAAPSSSASSASSAGGFSQDQLDALTQAVSQMLGSQQAAQQAQAPAQSALPTSTAQSSDPVSSSSSTGNGPGADRIRRTIDQMDPQHAARYQPRGVRGTPGRTTYCNVFAQDFMHQVGVPRQNTPTGNANNMNRWLNNQGPQHGWHQVSAAEAQRAANNGQVVLASQNNPNGPHGHVAVVRPGSTDGVHIAQAGGHNYNDAPVSRGFGRRAPQYFVYDGQTNGARQSPPATTPSTTAPSTNPSTQNQAPATQSPVQGPSSPTGQPLNLHDQFSSPDSTLSVAIGNAEGNRTVNGGRTRSYGGHTDPGNHAHNRGTFSYQGPGATTPEQADQIQLRRLQGQIPAYTQAAQRAGLDPNNPRLQAAYFDLWNQSPRMAGRFLQRMGQTLGNQPLTPQSIAAARTNAAYDDQGRFTSTGLHTPQRAAADQLRRENALEAVLRARGVV